MKKVVWTAVLAVVGVGLTAVGAGAQQPPQDRQQARIERLQARQEKLRARIEPRVQARIDKLDRNHDASVSRDEWTGAPKRFNKLDTNRDGVLTKDELVARLVDRRMSRRLRAARHR